MVLTVFFSSRISPRTSTVILRLRSPLATAVVTSAMLRTWAVRLPAMELTESVRSFHVPATPRTSAWPPSLPSVPTSRATRVTSEAKELGGSPVGGGRAGHEVDRVGQVLPRPGHPLHVGLTAKLAVGAHLAGHARHLRGE